LANRKTISIKALKGNTDVVYIGNSSAVSGSNGYELDANEILTVEVTSAAQFWAIAASGTQGVSVAEVA